jgi:hypothetical protein
MCQRVDNGEKVGFRGTHGWKGSIQGTPTGEKVCVRGSKPGKRSVSGGSTPGKR